MGSTYNERFREINAKLDFLPDNAYQVPPGWREKLGLDNVGAAYRYRAGQYDAVNYLLTLKPEELVQALKDMKAGLEPVIEKERKP